MVGEFHYRVPGRPAGTRPGAHPSRAEGAGGVYRGLRPLLAHADPRRIDLRRSAIDPLGQWLARTMTERVAVPLYVVADLSASMAFGAGKRRTVAELVESAAQSAWRTGDPFGVVAADARVRESLTAPAMRSRALGARLAAALRTAVLDGRNADGLAAAARYLGRRRALVLLASDFHFDLGFARRVLGTLAGHFVVPVVVWDAAESAGTMRAGWIEIADSESAATRFLWLRPKLAERLQAAIAARREALTTLFRSLGLRPLFLDAGFSAERMTRYFSGGDDAR